jgi:glycerol uptake facilitator protein
MRFFLAESNESPILNNPGPPVRPISFFEDRPCFATLPAIRSTGANLTSEIIGTFVLVMVVCAIFSKQVVWAIGLSLGGTTGYAINPARDLGPRVAHAFLPLGKRPAFKWSYAPIPVIGPLIGGAIAGFFAHARIFKPPV